MSLQADPRTAGTTRYQCSDDCTLPPLHAGACSDKIEAACLLAAGAAARMNNAHLTNDLERFLAGLQSLTAALKVLVVHADEWEEERSLEYDPYAPQAWEEDRYG